jgi:Tfp pilus assembly protein FimT
MDKRNIQIQKIEGFSLFEILLTIAILLLLSVFLFPFTIGKLQEVQLKNYSTTLTEDIYFQQQQARNKNIHTGIKLESGKYTLFTGETLRDIQYQIFHSMKEQLYSSPLVVLNLQNLEHLF